MIKTMMNTIIRWIREKGREYFIGCWWVLKNCWMADFRPVPLLNQSRYHFHASLAWLLWTHPLPYGRKNQGHHWEHHCQILVWTLNGCLFQKIIWWHESLKFYESTWWVNLITKFHLLMHVIHSSYLLCVLKKF